MSSDAAFYPVCVTWDEECSGYTPGAKWVYGGEYYAVGCVAWVPAYIVELGEEDAYLDDLEDIAWWDAPPVPSPAPEPVSAP